ncbi:RING finger and transmembrane domain-containing protein 2 isoform X2 [Cylas formicarius]|uniref:RING finger and transmembrane domain-containing protein 2 isoform X2 n=1 Tax=Cylas formicarius TaxID=197179 RepID=UPI00295885CE|nr:RING finger and transmembrane domain-containing protein 2 isoform X2 [Cylas formicarius]
MNQNSGTVPFQRSQSADFVASPQTRIGLLMTHSSGTLPTMSSPISFQRRTFESARQFRESFSSAMRQIEPLVETARNVRQNALTISEMLSRNQNEISHPGEPENTQQNMSYVSINLDGASTNNVVDNPGIRNNIHNHEAVFINQDGGGDNNNQEGENLDRLVNPLEAQQALHVLFKYVPFVLILLAKAVYDYHEGIFILVIMFGTFSHTNGVVKHEALKRARRSIWTLSIEMCYIFACMLSIHYFFEDDLHHFNVVMNLVLIRSFTHPLTVLNLLWIVTITDFTLKLITVATKILLTMLPGKIVEFKKRGKIYLFIEAVSQLYRSIATIQPWLYYLLESYQGPEKIVAVFLSAFYMISKGSDLMFKVRFLKTAFFKLLQTVCRHIFCESCVSTWFDREQTCPLCRAKIVDDPSWRDGSTSYFIQLF